MTAAVMMLVCCEQFAAEHNLQFSTDPSPDKSKCIFSHGKQTRMRKPYKLELLGEQLPWVAVMSGSMDHDALVKRARFIDKTIGIRESFSFAFPSQVIRAVQVWVNAI